MANFNLEKGPGNYLLLRSTFTDGTGAPAFKLVLPPGFEKDPGGRALALQEQSKGGYEIALRRVVLKALAAGDAFIDIGAHWGIYSLTVATVGPRDVYVVPVEPHPLNLTVLTTAIEVNRLGRRVTPIAAAAGNGIGLAPLMGGMGTMGHSVLGRNSPEQAKRPPELLVPTLSLDVLPRLRPKLKDRPLVVKVDVEGLEPEVVAGGKELLASGVVKALIVEKGHVTKTSEGLARFLEMTGYLESQGFRLFRLSDRQPDAKLTPLQISDDLFDVVAINPKRLTVPS
ncbi:MAG: FkbM family methyltransferase [Pseudomonadota bacterium]